MQTAPVADTSGSGGSAAGSSTTTGGSSAGSGVVPTGGQATSGSSTGGTPDGTSGTATGGATTGGTPAGGAGGTTGGGSGGGGAGGGSSVPMPMGPFSCTQFTGLLVAQEWWQGGIENDGVDGTKWQGKFQHYGYIDIWADPAGFAWAAPLTSPCTQNSLNPDRVVFMAWSWEIRDEAAYVKTTSDCVNTFKKNYPGMRRMDLITIARCP
ncbi:MAG TPA: hypothetical protein VNG33_08045, partial [Polyangiaceae bacterium]|nr:hypothetical protein [Polyangiaceae bacterium]